MTFLEWAIAHNACRSALIWIKDQPKQDVESLWNNCTHPDWMLWAHEKQGTENLEELLNPVRYLLAYDCMKSIIKLAEAAEFSVPEGVLTTITDEESLASAGVEAKRICNMAAEGIKTKSQQIQYANMALRANIVRLLITRKTWVSAIISACHQREEDITREQVADFIRCNVPPPKIKLD